MGKLKILNEFGIKPTFNHKAAGLDFCIPDFCIGTKDLAAIKQALAYSYGMTVDDVEAIKMQFENLDLGLSEGSILNAMHLYLATGHFIGSDVTKFCDKRIIIDENGRIGVKLHENEHIKINSGIRVALPSGYAGVFFNKSGRGSKGWDVRACVVDEDYTGFVHLSLAYTGKDSTGIIYCGDKLVQMLVLPVAHLEPEEVSSEEYYEEMENSERGDMGFGSGD